MFFKLLLFIILPYTLYSQTLELKDSMQNILGVKYMEVFEDKKHEFTIEQIKSKPFQIQKNNVTNHGTSSSVWWIRLKVQNNNIYSLTWKIKMMFGLIDHLEVWQFLDSTLVHHQLKGDHNIDVSNTAYLDRSVYTFSTKQNSQNEIYLKVSFEESGMAELFATIWTPDTLSSYLDQNINYLYAIFAGIFVLLFYNLFILLVLQSKIYFWYILYLLGVILILLTFNQIGAHYIWYNSIFLIDFIPLFAFTLVNISFLFFTRAFLETTKRLKKIDMFICILIIINIVTFILGVMGFRLFAMKLIHLLSFSFFLFPFIGAYLWNKGFTIARGYTIATSILSVTITISLVRALGLIPTNEFLYWLARLGFIFEGVFLAIALADRINIMQKSYIQAQENLNHSLEEKVKERTSELEKAKQIAEDLARKDALTGVWNRRAFSEMTQLSIENAHRHNIPLSLIMIDIDKFKKYNDIYGHEIGDIVIKSFANNLKNHTRDTDIFARIGGEEFVMVLPFAEIKDAKHKAETCRENIEKQTIVTKNKKLTVTASFGVAQLKENESLESLLSRADNAMYYVKNNGRNAVYCDES